MAGEKWTVAERKKFRSRLLSWFGAARRDLPWRRTRDPYQIWVSEIMLQQTRVAAVLDHYAEFLRRFPTINALAAASETDVLAAWSGLGYYRRARMLHLGAQALVNEYESVLPVTAAELVALPGIGQYTSAAIASIAFGESVAAVDGNVERVIARVAGLAAGDGANDSFGTRVRRLAKEMLDPEHPGDFNQAMMELGATLCLPRSPRCPACPVARLCQTRGPQPVTPRRPQMRQQIACALVVSTTHPQGMRLLLQQRPIKGSVMPSMWELPEIDDSPLDADSIKMIVRHAIMQTNYVVRVHAMSADDLPRHRLHELTECWIAPQALSLMPLTGLARKVLCRAGLMTASPALLSKGVSRRFS